MNYSLQAQDWTLAGNSNATNASFIGTTNNFPLAFKTNNNQRLKISNFGRMWINFTDAEITTINLPFNGSPFIKGGVNLTPTSSTDASGASIVFRNFGSTHRHQIFDSGTELVIDPLTTTNNVDVRGRMRINTSSVVPNLDSDYDLIVGKGILTERVKVAVKNSADWSDYVFAPEYELKPLSEVKKFIAANNHLPDVPCADEIVTNGLDVAEMDALLLKKIEELTLYTIQLDSVNKKT